MLEIALPCNVDAERFVLGSIILDHPSHAAVFSLLPPDDFSIEKHRRIFAAMLEMDQSGDRIDRVTLANSLINKHQLESVDGLSYLVSLDDGLPQFSDIESYVQIVRDKAALRKIIFAAQNLINRCCANDDRPGELISLAERTLMEIGYQPSESAELLSIGEVIERAGGLDAFLNPRMSEGVKTPWSRFTELVGGYRRKELFVIAGNPSHGKSAAAFQVAMDVAEAGHGALVYSLEMSRASLVRRMACRRARVDGAKFRADYLSREERRRLAYAINEVRRWPIWIAEHGISTVSAIRSSLRKQKTKHDVFMIVIDYLQLLQGVSKSQNRNLEISEITRQVKLLAMEDDINVQLLSQLSRENLREKRAPALHDLRESGSIEQDADAVMAVWRPEMLFRERPELKGQAEIILLKQRNGPTGKLKMLWIGSQTVFEQPTEMEDPREDEQ